jgi:hypothetical protein
MMTGPKSRFSAGRLLLWGLFIASCGVPPALAAYDQGVLDGRMAFSIPAQPLADALNAYGEATHIPMFVDTALTAGRHSSAVMGVLSPFDALHGLLAGTGLAARSIGNSGFTLAPMRAVSASSFAPSKDGLAASRFDRYSATIQRALHERLCRHQETQPGTFRTVVRLWIGGTGRISRSQVLTSTGDLLRDRILAAELQDFVVDEPPPPDLQQPVTLLLLPSVAGAAEYCLLSSVEQRQVDIR